MTQPLSVKEIIERLRHNSHDMGEMGVFIRTEYAENIVKSSLHSLLLEVKRRMQKKDVVWGQGNRMFDILTDRMGFNLSVDKHWNQVEFHLRIFGHLPEEDGAGMFICPLEPDRGREKLGTFIEKVCNESASDCHSIIDRMIKEAK